MMLEVNMLKHNVLKCKVTKIFPKLGNIRHKNYIIVSKIAL